jgi:hypothetical protein
LSHGRHDLHRHGLMMEESEKDEKAGGCRLSDAFECHFLFHSLCLELFIDQYFRPSAQHQL